MTEIALLFPGQGSQHVRMAAGLYEHDAVFTAAMDEVFAALAPDGAAVRADWLTTGRPAVAIDHVTRSQVLLFAVGHALGRVALSWGLRPAALLGHSAGELAAATLSGVFDVDVAARLMWERVTELEKAAPGGMLAVAATVDEVAPFLAGDVVVGAVNAPRQLILAGPAAPLADVAARLRAARFTCRPVPATVAFHSPALAGTAARCAPAIAAARPRTPRIPLISGYTAKVLTDTEAADPAFWAGHPVEPVLFWQAVGTLLGEGSPLPAGGSRVLVEAGPSQGLAKVARLHPVVRAGGARVLTMLPGRPLGAEADRAALAEARESLMAAVSR